MSKGSREKTTPPQLKLLGNEHDPETERLSNSPDRAQGGVGLLVFDVPHRPSADAGLPGEGVLGETSAAAGQHHLLRYCERVGVGVHV